jgi:hypothetical protein
VEAAEQARRQSDPPRLNPLVLVPYLSGEQLEILEGQAVSGIDLCGNGVVVVPGQLLVCRTGAPNRFLREGKIKNVYRRNSSVVARAFLLVPEFPSVSEARSRIVQWGGAVTLATVSKVCSAMEEDLVIERKRTGPTPARQIRLLQPDKLLDLLAANYQAPDVTRTFSGRTTLAPEGLREALGQWQQAGKGQVVRTGADSVEAYAVMARDAVQTFYCTDVAGVVRWLGERVREGARFANVRFLETRDALVYFDHRPGLVSSPIQTYLELEAGDKRDRETAEQVRRAILEPLAGALGRGG